MCKYMDAVRKNNAMGVRLLCHEHPYAFNKIQDFVSSTTNIEEYDVSSLLVESFNWRDTVQGWGYWADVHYSLGKQFNIPNN